MMEDKAGNGAYHKYLPTGASLIVIITGFLVLAGWFFNLPVLQSILPNLPKMTFNTAVTFILAGLSLLFLSRTTDPAAENGRQRQVALALAVLVTLIGLITFSQYLFGWDLGVDQLLFQDEAGAAETTIPGRPSPHSAITFTLAGLSLLLYHRKSGRSHWLAQYLSLITAFIPMLALVGYIYSIPFFFQISTYTGMALHTAFSFIILCTGLLFLRPDQSFAALLTGGNMGGLSTRRLLLVAVAIPLVVGWVSILGEQAGFYEPRFQPVLLAVASAYALSAAIWWYAHSLNQIVADREQAEEQFRLVVEATPTAIILVNITGNIMLVNQQAELLFGYSRQELIDQPVEKLIPQQFHTHHNHYRTAFFSSPTARPMGAGRDLFGLRKDGSQVPVEIGLNPISTIDGFSVLASIIDITERKRSEATIAESFYREQAARVEAEEVQQRLAFLAEASSALASSLNYHKTLAAVAHLAVPRIADWCAVDVVEPDGSLSRVAVVHTDPAKVELAYKLQRRYPPDPNQPHGIYQVLRTGQPEFHPEISEDMLMNSLNEEQFNLIRDLGLKSVITMPIMSRDQALGVISFVMAESNRHYGQADLELTNQLANRAALAVDNARLYHEATKLNEELEQRVIDRTAELEAANMELAAFSYSVSHDLRAPLRSIDGFSQALLEDYHDSLEEEAQNYLERIRAASQRMAQLIDDLLMLSRMTRSQMHHERINLSEQARMIIDDLQEIEPDRQVTCTITPGITVEADRQLIWAALENLLGNAWKFSGNRFAAEIEFGVMPQLDGPPIYYVRDNGAGFDMTYAEKLFGAFQRLHSSAEFPGTGIGLATVQRIIHRHGGRIWAEGEVNKGATFYFTLPS